ncbi:MAG: hypothetical protein DLM60_14980 [Pseudonocardiales bacterium]|nr:YdeI/OmpD-associated family protein [Actinomycetota bacterium]PZS16800.1 MAG: hypothetical protein DLM60_14980 [Pseudonocardiales bacterium]
MRFRTTVGLGGKTATGLPVPDDVIGALGSGKRPAVWIEDAKKPDTSSARVAKTVAALRAGERSR